MNLSIELAVHLRRPTYYGKVKKRIVFCSSPFQARAHICHFGADKLFVSCILLILSYFLAVHSPWHMLCSNIGERVK